MDEMAKNIIKVIAHRMSNPSPDATAPTIIDIASSLNTSPDIIAPYLQSLIAANLIVQRDDQTYFMVVEQVILAISLYAEYLKIIIDNLTSRIVVLENR